MISNINILYNKMPNRGYFKIAHIANRYIVFSIGRKVNDILITGELYRVLYDRYTYNRFYKPDILKLVVEGRKNKLKKIFLPQLVPKSI